MSITYLESATETELRQAINTLACEILKQCGPNAALQCADLYASTARAFPYETQYSIASAALVDVVSEKLGEAALKKREQREAA